MSGFGVSGLIILGVILIVIIGIIVANRKNKKR
ncbi:LPXTG cell wall anchor domain-containing protein [Brevibacillus laterosporus]|nr:LPXTG cell wall anchor domain-containing protein [Brevibacillus laterosporus]